ncbi:MAG: hypothetical protein JSS72_10860 [Armatimonadetes bacterium]|nr:hypothetical protein [Armatimonadota bacterium]
MIQCPNCNQTLPDWVQSCQFCGADTKKVVRPKPVKKQVRVGSGYSNPALIWGLYYFFAAWWILDGAGLLFLSQQVRFFSTFLLVCGTLCLAFGLGLILRIPLIRNIANYIAFIGLIGYVLDLFFSFLMMLGMGWTGLLLALFLIFNICICGAQIWVLGETDGLD